MTIFRQAKAVFWSFVGLAPPEARGGRHEKMNPLVLLAIAFAFVLLFLGSLAFIAHLVVTG